MMLQFDSNANVEYRCYRVANANFAVDGQGASGIATMPTMVPNVSRCESMVADDAADISREKQR